MVTNAIAPRQNLLPATGNLAIEGMESLDQGDLILPRKTIIQATSKKEGADEHLGHFHDNLTNEMVPTIEAVILNITRTRTLWAGGDGSDRKPECGSYDGISGRTYGACNECHFNPEVNPTLWDEKDLKRCDRGYLFLCCDRRDGSLFLLGAMKTSVKPAKVLISSFAQKRKSPFSAVVKWETYKVIDDKGKYYVLKPSITTWLTADEANEYREMYLALRGVQVADIDPDAHQEAATPAGEGPEPF